MIDQTKLNTNLSLSRVIDVLGMPEWLKTKDSAFVNALMAEVFGVYLGHRTHPAENVPDRWLTITVGSSTDDICINQSRGEKRGDIEVYHSLLASGLTSVMHRLMRAKLPQETKTTVLNSSVSHYVSQAPLPTPGFCDDGSDTPIQNIVWWLNDSGSSLYALFARLVEENFERIAFLKFPHDNAMAIIGKLKPEKGDCRITTSVLSLHLDNPFQGALQALLREHAGMQQANTFDFITSINPSVDESAR